MPPPPSSPSKEKLPPPPPPADAVRSDVLPPPPPPRLPGTFTPNDELRERADLFHLNWQAEQANIEKFTTSFEVPTHRVLPRGKQVMVRVMNNEPIFYGTDAPVSGTTAIIPQAVAADGEALWQLGLTGSFTACPGVWDVGAVLASHQEFSARVTQGDAPSSTSDHATHVAGTIIAAGTDVMAQGIAYEACLQAYDWENANSEMAAAAADGLSISNHSYGVMSGWVHVGTDTEGKNQWCWYGNPNVSASEDYKFGFYSWIKSHTTHRIISSSKPPAMIAAIIPPPVPGWTSISIIPATISHPTLAMTSPAVTVPITAGTTP